MCPRYYSIRHILFFIGCIIFNVSLAQTSIDTAMSGIAGVVYTFRFSTAQADNGVGIELLVISAILLGGVSIFGGIGTMWGVVAGVLLAGSVESWLTLREINAQWRTIVTGLLLLLSVAAPVLVQKSRNRRERKALKS